jgi:hypothetical protein
MYGILKGLAAWCVDDELEEMGETQERKTNELKRRVVRNGLTGWLRVLCKEGVVSFGDIGRWVRESEFRLGVERGLEEERDCQGSWFEREMQKLTGEFDVSGEGFHVSDLKDDNEGGDHVGHGDEDENDSDSGSEVDESDDEESDKEEEGIEIVWETDDGVDVEFERCEGSDIESSIDDEEDTDDSDDTDDDEDDTDDDADTNDDDEDDQHSPATTTMTTTTSTAPLRVSFRI